MFLLGSKTAGQIVPSDSELGAGALPEGSRDPMLFAVVLTGGAQTHPGRTGPLGNARLALLRTGVRWFYGPVRSQ